MSESSTATAAVYSGLPVPPGTSGSCTPPSSLYWIQKSASSNSNAAGNRSNAASPSVRPPLASAVRMLANSPAPIVPAVRAIVLPRKERRLRCLLRDLTLVSELFIGECSFLPEPFAVGLSIVFMPVESLQPTLRALLDKLHVCYLPACFGSDLIQPR